MKEFIINEHLSLKLEEESEGELKLDEIETGELGEYFIKAKLSFKTNIYVQGKKFRQCMFLLLEIPIKEINSFDEITSIDEASELLDRSEETEDASEEQEENGYQKIPPETEFWGHCSNLQAWYENGYDTRLIHRNLAFPLLRELTDAGDPLAKRVFREEIAQRLESGFLPVISYLLLEHYTYYLSDNYFGTMAQSQMMIDILFKTVESKDSVFKFISLYLFHRLYNYLNGDIIQKFVDFIKQDKEYIKNLLNDPILLTNDWIYYNPTQLYSIRVALILDSMINTRYHGKIDYDDLKRIYYLEDIIFEIIMFKNSIDSITQDLVFEQEKPYIKRFLTNAYEKNGKLTKETISNCEQKFEEIIKKINIKLHKSESFWNTYFK